MRVEKNKVAYVPVIRSNNTMRQNYHALSLLLGSLFHWLYGLPIGMRNTDETTNKTMDQHCAHRLKP